MQLITKWIRKHRFKINSQKKNWRAYKRFFLKKKDINLIVRFKHIFNNARIFKKHYSHEHINKSVYLIDKYRTLCLKKSYNKTYQFFHRLQFRVHLVLLSAHFVFNKIDALILLKEGLIAINNKVIISQTCILTFQDVLYVFLHSSRFNRFTRNLLLLLVRKRRFKRERRFRHKFLRRSLLQNFFEINYYTRSLIYIRSLRNNELSKIKGKWTKTGIRKPTKLLNVFNFNLIKKFWAFS